uniref:RNA-directed DNA polymerase; Ribonuclease H, related n=1 Tax=Medicago truncatula TaxID=3880 RepID=A2Q4M3_MEDTR|nr:RNA-directed DNA polymerase; Ribonuclease H, related [Medicago truncatula]
MSTSNLCSRCQTSEEFILHCIRDCPFAMNLWKTLGFINVNFFSNMNLLDWIKSHSNGSAANIFLAGFWWNWKARNIVCVGNDSIELFSVVSEARRLSSLLSVCFPPQHAPESYTLHFLASF